jgi:hypothetical protein
MLSLLASLNKPVQTVLRGHVRFEKEYAVIEAHKPYTINRAKANQCLSELEGKSHV